jgi:hypothetical protein
VILIGRQCQLIGLESRLIDQGGHQCGEEAHDVGPRFALPQNGLLFRKGRDHEAAYLRKYSFSGVEFLEKERAYRADRDAARADWRTWEETKGELLTVLANKQIIVAAGALTTPQLLMILALARRSTWKKWADRRSVIGKASVPICRIATRSL